MCLFKKIYTTLYFSIILLALSSFNTVNKKSVSSANLLLRFENYVDDKLLRLDSVNYKNELGQIYDVSKFKYYISNIHLKRSDGTEYISDEYFLVNEGLAESKKILLNDIEPGEYTSISFIIGVDSLRNCSGIQSGALDPMNGMFWAWNTGYIFLKIEGRAPESKSSGHIYEFHIGGFKEPSNCIRRIQLNFNNEKIKLQDGIVQVLKIKADVGQIFKSPTAIDFTKLSSVTDFNNASVIADNYSDMFSLLTIE